MEFVACIRPPAITASGCTIVGLRSARVLVYLQLFCAYWKPDVGNESHTCDE